MEAMFLLKSQIKYKTFYILKKYIWIYLDWSVTILIQFVSLIRFF